MSGSAAFEINLEDITAVQLHKLIQHVYFGKKVNIDFLDGGYSWTIEQVGDVVRGTVLIETSHMWYFMKEIGIDPEKQVKWTRYYRQRPTGQEC